MMGKLLRFEKRDENYNANLPNAGDSPASFGAWKPVQQSLFPFANVVVIVSLSEEIGTQLLAVVTQARPGYVFDFRPVPRFDFGNMSRSRAFECFENLKSQYIEIKNSADGAWRAQILKRFPNQTDRPLMFLVNEGYDDLENAIVCFISENRNWAIHKLSNQASVENIAKLKQL
jgi:hypothetical protein